MEIQGGTNLTKLPKLLYLESVRGIAAVIVVLSHIALAFYPAMEAGNVAPIHSRFDLLLYNNPLDLILAGNFSVCLFFIMSGFVLVRPYFATKRTSSLTNAALRRYFRLMPPVAISILAAYLLLRFGFMTNQTAAHLTGSTWLGSLWAFVPHAHDALYQAFIGAFFDNQVTYNPLLWTMTTEFLGSLLIFAIAGLIGNQPKRWIVYITLVIIFLRSYYLGFIIGLIFADYLSDPGRLPAPKTSRTNAAKLTLALLAGLLLGTYPADGLANLTKYRHLALPKFTNLQLIGFWHTVAAAIVIFCILMWPAAQRALSARPLVKLGKMSFALYCTHMIILCSLASEAFTIFHSHFGYRTATALTFAESAVIMMGVAYYYMRFVDTPAIHGSRRIGNWLTTKSSRTSAPTEAPAATATVQPSADTA